jgi:hypothetical protein
MSANHPDLDWLRTVARGIGENSPPPAGPNIVVDITSPPGGTTTEAPRPRPSIQQPALATTAALSLKARLFWLLLAIGAGYLLSATQNNADLAAHLDAIAADKRALASERSELNLAKAQNDRDRAAITQQRQQIEADAAKNLADRQALEREKASLQRLDSLPSPPPAAAAQPRVPKLDFQIAQLSPSKRIQWGISPYAYGVLVIGSDTSSKAYRDGIRPGVLILQVDSTVILSTQQFANVVAALVQAGKQTVPMYIQTGTQPPAWRFVAVQ